MSACSRLGVSHDQENGLPGCILKHIADPLLKAAGMPHQHYNHGVGRPTSHLGFFGRLPESGLSCLHCHLANLGYMLWHGSALRLPWEDQDAFWTTCCAWIGTISSMDSLEAWERLPMGERVKHVPEDPCVACTSS